MKYADYTFYKNEYNGTLTSVLFNLYLPKASFEVANNVNKTLEDEDITDEVKMVTCELVELLNDKNDANTDNLTIDGVSITKKDVSVNDFEVRKHRILNKLPEKLTRYI